jgi:hypothetical protein
MGNDITPLPMGENLGPLQRLVNRFEHVFESVLKGVNTKITPVQVTGTWGSLV